MIKNSIVVVTCAVVSTGIAFTRMKLCRKKVTIFKMLLLKKMHLQKCKYTFLNLALRLLQLQFSFRRCWRVGVPSHGKRHYTEVIVKNGDLNPKARLTSKPLLLYSFFIKLMFSIFYWKQFYVKRVGIYRTVLIISQRGVYNKMEPKYIFVRPWCSCNFIGKINWVSFITKGKFYINIEQ